MGSTKIQDIQVLRALAILLVLAQHLSITPYVFGIFFVGYQMPFWSGVELFFVISGYVVTTSLLDRPVAPLGFLIRRAFRLLPAMLCFLAFGALITYAAWALPVTQWGKETIAGSLPQFLIEAARILTGTLTLYGGTQLYTNAAMWSLSVEFQFYFAYAALLLVLWCVKTLPLRGIVFCLATALYLICLLARFVPSVRALSWLIDYAVALGFEFLFLGVIGAAGLRQMMPTLRLPYGPLAAIGLLVCSQVLLAQGPTFGSGATGAAALVMPLAGLCFLAMVLLAATNSAVAWQGSAFYRSLTWIGELSYSIYLFHFPMFALFWIATTMAWPAYWASGDPGVLQAALAVPATIALALVVYLWVEMPMNRLGARLAAQRQAQPA